MRDDKKYIEYLLRNLERLDSELKTGFKTFCLIKKLTKEELDDFRDDIYIVKGWYKRMTLFHREIVDLRYNKRKRIKEIADLTHYSESYIKEVITNEKKILLCVIKEKDILRKKVIIKNKKLEYVSKKKVKEK